MLKVWLSSYRWQILVMILGLAVVFAAWLINLVFVPTADLVNTLADTGKQTSPLFPNARLVGVLVTAAGFTWLLYSTHKNGEI